MHTWTIEELMTVDLAPQQVDDVCAKIAPLLAGLHPAIQGAVLADLTATWLAGHPPELRGDLHAHHIEKTNALIEPNAQAIRDRIAAACATIDD